MQGHLQQGGGEGWWQLPLALLLQEGQCDVVVGMSQVAQGLNDGDHSCRSVETEGFVAHHLQLWNRGVEVLGNDGYVSVGTHQDGDVGWRHSLVEERQHLVGQQLQRLSLIVVGRQQPHLHLPFVGTVVGHQLLHVVVGRHFLVLGSLGEEGVVEVDDAAGRAPIHAEGLHIHHLMGVAELRFDAGQQPPVATAPAVDALLHVAHDEVLGAFVAHRLLQQHLEVLPLHGAGVLKLVDHDMLQLRANLLEDEGRVAAVDELMKQLLGVGKEESVLLLVELVHLLLDAGQQSQLTQVAQRQVGALVELPLARLLVEGLAQQVAQRRVGQMVDEVAAGVGLPAPLVGLPQAVGGALAQHRLVELATLQLQKQASHSFDTMAQVVDVEALAFERLEEGIANILHPPTGLLAQLVQLLLIALEESFLVHHGVELLAVAFIIVAEDGASKDFDLPDDIPRAVVVDVVHDVLQQPLQHLVGGRERVDELVDGQLLHLHIVQPYAQVGREVQLASQVAHHALEERVDGLHAEMAVVVEQQMQGLAGALGNLLLRQLAAQCRVNLLGIRLGVVQTTPDAIELAQYAHLHLLRRLVGKRHGQNLPVVLRIAHQELDIL